MTRINMCASLPQTLKLQATPHAALIDLLPSPGSCSLILPQVRGRYQPLCPQILREKVKSLTILQKFQHCLREGKNILFISPMGNRKNNHIAFDNEKIFIL